MVESRAYAAAVTPSLESSRLQRHSSSAALSPSHSNADAHAAAAARKPKPKPKPKTRLKDVASRYLNPASSKPTPTADTIISSRRSASPAPRRPAERSRPVEPRFAADDAPAPVSRSTTATRTVSIAFQSPFYYSLDTSKAGQAMSPAAIAAITPDKRRSSVSSAPKGKVFDVRWPAAAKPAFDETTPRRASVDGAEHLRALSSYTESASSAGAGIASGAHQSSRSIMSSSSRILRDAVGSRSDRFFGQATPFLPRTPGFVTPSPRTATVKKKSLFNAFLSSQFNRSSPRQPSPTKPAGISPKRTGSPSPASAGFAGKLPGKGSTCCNLDSDMRKKAPRDHKAEEEHRLRILHNRHLQWRLANAYASATLSAQALVAEEHLCGAWIAIIGMRRSVALRKIQLQLLRNDCKAMAILRGQMIHLVEWSLLEKEHANSLSGAVKVLNATILRLPVSDGAVAYNQAVKNAVGSAVDAAQVIGNATNTLMSKLVRANELASQLSRVAIQECALMAQCRVLLSTLASMHVKYCSLQGQRIQLKKTNSCG